MAPESSYWRSLRELYNRDSVSEQKAHEFMAGVTDDFDPSEMSTMSRTQFLSLLTASAAFAAVGCNAYRDKGEIVPYTIKPEEVTPGVANYYASTCTVCGQGCGILIKTREGRPIKVDGNPDHPISRGKVCTKGQASILSVYDPYRLRKPQYGPESRRRDELTWDTANAEVVRRLEEAAREGKEVALVTRGLTSPTAKRVFDDLKKKYPTVRVYAYSLFNDDTRQKAWQSSYGSTDVPAIAYDRAKVIVALEADILSTEGSVVEQVRQFAAGRDVTVSNDINRLYCVEGGMSLTGANADYRLRLRPDAQEEFVFALLRQVAGNRLPADVSGSPSLADVAQKHGLAPEVLKHLADDLLQHRGEAIVVAGHVLSERVHVAVNYLNEVLGNADLYRYDAVTTTVLPLSSSDDFAGLAGRMRSGSVAVVIHANANPVYHLPGEYGYREALESVPFSVSLTGTDDETSRICTFVLPVHHAFESWGDHQVRSGVVSLQQPVIAPLYDTHQLEGALLGWTIGANAYSETLYLDYLKKRWEAEIYPAIRPATDFRTFWLSSLHDGVVTLPQRPGTHRPFKTVALGAGRPSAAGEGAVVVLQESPYLGDGDLANNGWLQELPHPVSKIVWDNYAALSPATGKKLGVTSNDLLEVRSGDAVVVLPVFLQPGQADDLVTVPLGYGRRVAGPVGSGVGVDVMPLLNGSALLGSRVLTGASLSKAAGTYELVSTQEHHSLDDALTHELHLKRQIVREGTVEEFRSNPTFLHEKKHELFNIAPTVEYDGVKWAMAIDLNKCIGCNACVVGCNVENNIPVIGKEQVGKGREMQWMRIDRYYAGTAEDPTLSHQPMLCQHCDNAPCENVCPVAATTHSPDGLNQMVYNRCVGTKYCSNNCPYKVRRFNFFNWRDDFADGYYEQQPVSLVHNPEVTIRSRGVMEKCTFCVQRISEARQRATEEGRPVRGTDVKTACQEACPATAIVFGDANDQASEISRYRDHALGYHVLEEINVRPNVTYLARLRNIHKENPA